MRFRNDLVCTALALTTCGAATAQDWYQETPNTAPPARRFHGMDFDARRGVTVLFGGIDERQGTVFGDTWEYDGTDWAHETATGPGPRQRFGSCFDRARGVFVVFGGVDDGGTLRDDTWTWDGAQWAPVATAHAPAPRLDFEMVFDEARGRIVLFGGRPQDASTPFGDTWTFDGYDWIELAPAHAPDPRYGHAMTYDPGRGTAVLFGGFANGANRTSTDTWEFDGSDWREVATATVPSSAVFPAMTFQRAHGVAVLAGATGSPSPAVQTWVFDGVDWQRGPIAPREQWGRQGHGLAYDGARDMIVLFGGGSITFGGILPRDDTWELSEQAMLEPFGHGCASSAGLLELAARDGARPQIGTKIVFEAKPIPAGAAPLLLLGFDDAYFGGVGLPFELSPIGLPGCGLFTSIEAALPMATAGTTAARSLGFARDPGLLGRVLFAQTLIAPPEGATSNAAKLTIGN